MKKYNFRNLTGKKPLTELLSEEGIFQTAYCGGNGTCGKCGVKIIGDETAENEYDRAFFSEEELKEGWRLSCKAFPKGDIIVELKDSDDGISVESGFRLSHEHAPSMSVDGYAVAVDIGTTTIACSLIDTKTGEILKTSTGINKQRAFGADVLSRIVAANEGKLDELRDIIRKDLKTLISEITHGISDYTVIISGNTTMQHLLAGYSCESLGVYPFTPVNISAHTVDDMEFMPGISTYVGSDIVSGIVACGIDKSERLCAMVDLGTNGEMAVGNRDGIMVTSTAAGPAFEGGNISCGTAGIPGAVYEATFVNGRMEIGTLGGLEAVGICGSGVLEITRELVKSRIVDETGLMDDEYFDDGFEIAKDIVFTQHDVRQVQLAKAAIRAGLETLIETYGAEIEDIETLFLAGGFGKNIDLKKASDIGLIPQELLEKTVAVGNSSLAGAVLYAKSEEIRERAVNVAENSKEVSLAMSPAFNDKYIEYMLFE